MSRTIHVTVPNDVYEELQELAEELGLSVSGLVKMFIKEGLARHREKRRRLRAEAEEESDKAVEVMVEVLSRLESLQRMVEERLTAIEGDLYRLRVQLNNLRRRVSRLEDVVEDKLMPVEVEAEGVTSQL